jgi:hypothetical protein
MKLTRDGGCEGGWGVGRCCGWGKQHNVGFGYHSRPDRGPANGRNRRSAAIHRDEGQGPVATLSGPSRMKKLAGQRISRGCQDLAVVSVQLVRALQHKARHPVQGRPRAAALARDHEAKPISK